MQVFLNTIRPETNMRDQRSVMAYNKTFKGIVIKAVSKIRLSVLYGFSVCSKDTYNLLIDIYYFSLLQQRMGIFQPR